MRRDKGRAASIREIPAGQQVQVTGKPDVFLAKNAAYL